MDPPLGLYIGSNDTKASMDANPVDSVPMKVEKKRQKRQKPIKSCAFCRKRKLRCDQKKPSCSTCVTRGLTECVYSEKFRTGMVSEDIFSSTPNVTLLKKVSELERQLEGKGETSSTISMASQLSMADMPVQMHSTNILRKFYYLERKKVGRRMLHGPTSTKTFVMNSTWGLTKKFRQLWEKVKVARNLMKQTSGFTMLKENSLIEEPLDTLPYSLSESCLLKEVCRALPSYEVLLKAINFFFEDEERFEINQVLDKEKIIRDFKEGFIPGLPVPATGERPIIKLIPSGKKNYYKIGVIISIVNFAYYYKDTPSTIEKFLVFLVGLSTAKVMYIERVQVLFLRYTFRIQWGYTGGESSHTLLLRNLMTNEACLLGLNRDIFSLYGNEEELVGNLQSLEKLWCCILYADFDSALKSGCSINVAPHDIYYNEMFDDESKTLYGLLKRFLKMARPMLWSTFDRDVTPDLKSYCETIIDFIEFEFPPIWHYTGEKLLGEVSLSRIRILCCLLSMLLAFYGLRFLALEERTVQLKNGLLLATTISASLSVNLMLHCFELDKQKYPELLKQDCKSLTPYLCLAVSVLNGLLGRSLALFYGTLYYKITLFERAMLISDASIPTYDWDLRALRVQGTSHISLLSAFGMFCGIFDRLTDNDDRELKMVFRRSHALVITISLERVSRTVVQKALDSRIVAENSWMAQSQQEIPPASSNLENGCCMPQNTKILPDSATTLECPLNTNDTTPPPMNTVATEQEMEGTEMLSEDFWATYNVLWERLLSDDDYGQLLASIMTNE